MDLLDRKAKFVWETFQNRICSNTPWNEIAEGSREQFRQIIHVIENFEEEELEREAEALWLAYHDGQVGQFEFIGEHKERWIRAAKKAREIYGKDE